MVRWTARRVERVHARIRLQSRRARAPRRQAQERRRQLFEVRYYDIVADERIVYAYEMHLDDNKISVSLATREFKADGGSCRLTMHEDGAFLDGHDGHDGHDGRRNGTESLLDALAKSLARAPSVSTVVTVRDRRGTTCTFERRAGPPCSTTRNNRHYARAPRATRSLAPRRGGGSICFPTCMRRERRGRPA
ncbi:MAG: SRPBCC domain-containing protein [Deltaproteobacteria bacterium]